MAEDQTHAQIATMIADNDIVLFMKGTKQFPQCGFSATAAKILEHLGVPYKDVNVLEDPGVRDGIRAERAAAVHADGVYPDGAADNYEYRCAGVQRGADDGC